MTKRDYVLLMACILTHTVATASDNSNANEMLYSNLSNDEHITMFNTHSWFDNQQQSWIVPIHGWAYEPQSSEIRKAAVSKALKLRYGLQPTQSNQGNLTERVNLLLADNERNKKIVIELAGKRYALPRSAANGHFQTTLSIPATELSSEQSTLVNFSVILAPGDTRTFTGQTTLLAEQGLSIISDIDDTIKVSNVTERKALMQATFFDDFVAVDKMPQLYQKWHNLGAKFHFVSSSPWQLYIPLKKFLNDENFPHATMSLKSIRFKDQTLLNLFKSGTRTKPVAIRRIIDSYPKRQFVLVGDSGEQDAEVYAQIAQEYPDQITKIFIRNINQDSTLNKRYEAVFSKIDKHKWHTFESATELFDAI